MHKRGAQSSKDYVVLDPGPRDRAGKKDKEPVRDN